MQEKRPLRLALTQSSLGTGGNRGDDSPAAYLNYILFDRDYNVLDMGFTAAAGYNAPSLIDIPTVNVEEPGYIFIYLSYENESNNYVEFDDFYVLHTPSNVVQYNDYYPFGVQAETSWTRDNSSNNFLYNAGSELNGTSGWYETFFRSYDPTLGRFGQTDPMAAALPGWSPYNYGINDPIYYNDPLGDYVEPVLRTENPGTMRNYAGSGGFSNYVSQLYSGEAVQGAGGHHSSGTASGVTEFSIGGMTVTIDWGKIGENGVSLSFNNGIFEDMSVITERNGVYGYTETYVTGTGYHDITFGERFVAFKTVQQGLTVFASGNFEKNFQDAMEYMNGLSGTNTGYIMNSGKIAVLPPDQESVKDKHNKRGYFIKIDGKWEKAQKMLISGFTNTWGAYPWDDLAKRSYHLKDSENLAKARGLGVISLIYFNDPPRWDHSVTPPTQTEYWTEIFIKK